MLTNAATVATTGTRRITQLQYLLQLPPPTSENAVNAKFAEFCQRGSSHAPPGRVQAPAPSRREERTAAGKFA